MAIILGISSFYHDSAAALIRDGDVLAAAQEERFSRIKHDESFPSRAIEFCLNSAGIDANQIDHVVFYEKPFLKFERLLETHLSFAPKGFSLFRTAMPIWLSKKLFQKSEILSKLQNIRNGIDWEKKLLFSEHHLSHAASAFFLSPFREAIVLTMDGVGEHATTSIAIGKENQLWVEKEIHFPHSVGLLYSAFTYFLGFKVNSGEYKVMGLAPYGTPKYKDLILENLIDLKDDGSFRLNMNYFDYCTGLKMTNHRFSRLFGVGRRNSEDVLQQIHFDLAASIQAVLEEIVLRLSKALKKEYNISNLCLAGGVALNCVANGKLVKEKIFDEIWIQPAAGDAGGALGAAFVGYHLHLQRSRVAAPKDGMKGAYLGPHFSQAEVELYLTNIGAKYKSLSEHDLLDQTVSLLIDGKVVGWHQGKMEFGPRSLGARSILADPRSEDMQRVLNTKIKFRESFRPFAPVIPKEKLGLWFDLKVESPYMLLVGEILEKHRKLLTEADRSLEGTQKLSVKRSCIPAVTHVDYSARVQTVDSNTNPRLHALLTKFEEQSGVPILVNTSFNIRGEPMVCSPEDSFRCFMETDMDVLVIENCILNKEDQNPSLKSNYRSQVQPD